MNHWLQIAGGSKVEVLSVAGSSSTVHLCRDDLTECVPGCEERSRVILSLLKDGGKLRGEIQDGSGLTLSGFNSTMKYMIGKGMIKSDGKHPSTYTLTQEPTDEAKS